MKVVHVPYTYHPDATGGTEVYVEGLARGLAPLGVESLICAPGARDESYEHSGLRIFRFATRGDVDDVAYCYDEGDEVAAHGFDEILRRERPDLVHLHAFTPAVSLRLARKAEARAVPLVLTYHSPTVTCERGTLLRWGEVACDGIMEWRSCAACGLHGRGLARLAAGILGRVPVASGRMLEAQGLSGGAWTALRTTHSVDSRHRSARSLFSLVERIIAPSRWVAAVLRSNGVPDAKIVLCPQGVTKRDGGGEAVARGEDRRPALRAAFAGRLDPAKGAHVVVEAMGLLRGEDIALDLFAVVPGSDDPYYGKLRAACAKDARIRLMPAIPNREMIGVLGGYDVVVVPSQGFETGPLVVLEAFAAGVPVLGSDIGGIAERVRHGVDGLLIPRADPAAWAGALAKLASDAGALARLRSGIRPSRSMADVCVEMKAVYAALVPPAAHAVTRTR